MTSNMFRIGSSRNQAAAATSSKQPLQKRLGGAGSEKGLDAKLLRRLAQNREAARKCRIRKKAYVEELECSRIRLGQLEQDLERARAQGVVVAGGAMAFEIEYGKWLEEDERHMMELRGGVESSEMGELRGMVEAYVGHLDEIFRVKEMAARSDALHLLMGTWASPAERCLLWIGGFRPSHLIKVLLMSLQQMEEMEYMGLYKLQQSSQQAEDALNQGLHQLHHSLIDTVFAAASHNGAMPIALAMLSNLQAFLRQADNLRQQTLHQLCRILTLPQAARSFILIGEYYTRLRALSHLWASRPTESMIGGADTTCQTSSYLQMLHPAASQNQFLNFSPI